MINIAVIAVIAFAILTCVSPFVLKLFPATRNNGLLSKMISSFFFLVTGVLAMTAVGFSRYSVLIAAGLSFGVLGDFLLDYKGAKHFFLGVLAFAVNHLIYITAYLFVCKPSDVFDYKLITVMAVGMAVLSFVILKINKIHFKKGERRIIPYCFVLLVSFMLVINRGIQAFTVGNLPLAVCLVSAASLFIVSDSALAMVKFGDPPVKNIGKIINPFYFCAQAAFATSILFV